jgi:hypothetical protein
LPVPGTTLALAERPILPVFLHSSAPRDATPGAILSWGSALLHGMSRSTPPPASRPEAPLLGFHAPTTLEEERVHVRLSSAPRFCRGFCPRVPPRRLRCRSQVFSTSQRPSSSPYRPTIFRWVAFLGLALQGFSFHEAPPTRRRAAYPLDVAPAGCAIPVPRRGTRRHGGGYLECFDRHLLSSTGSSSSWKSIVHPANLMNVVSDLPLLGFYLLMVCTRAIEEGFPPLDRRAWRTARRRLRATRCPPRLSDHPGRPSLTTGPSHPKVPRLHPPPSLGVPPARAYRPCDLLPRPAVPRRRDPCVPLSAV